jgi:hypothetical protein
VSIIITLDTMKWDFSMVQKLGKTLVSHQNIHNICHVLGHLYLNQNTSDHPEFLLITIMKNGFYFDDSLYDDLHGIHPRYGYRKNSILPCDDNIIDKFIDDEEVGFN